MKIAFSLILACSLVLPPALADERLDHFEGLPANTLEQALTNIENYNAQLAPLVRQEELSAPQMHEIHQLTYTLENALEKIRAEYSDLAEILEQVHIASETADPETVKIMGKAYLDKTDQLVP